MIHHLAQLTASHLPMATGRKLGSSASSPGFLSVHHSPLMARPPFAGGTPGAGLHGFVNPASSTSFGVPAVMTQPPPVPMLASQAGLWLRCVLQPPPPLRPWKRRRGVGRTGELLDPLGAEMVPARPRPPSFRELLWGFEELR